MQELKKLPVGFENFQEIRKLDFYYVDKTKLVEQLLENWSKVNLFTRPRRFGKTLNMSMLKSFFEIGTDTALFDGLYISQNEELCKEYMGKYPVIFLSLKGVDGLTFEEARSALCELIAGEVRRFKFLLNSSRLDNDEKNIYRDLISLQGEQETTLATKLKFSLKKISELLYQHYGQKTIVLIDEYDVPLDKAFQHGYYREMVALIRGLFGEALKTNDFLQFAVLTGCLRVSKESIFTGLNNFKVYSADDVRYDEEFGFTNEEVKKLLEDYNLQKHFTEVKEWYDGYRFGNADIYCPWDVMNYLFELQHNPKTKPVSYWKNTSDNAIIRSFIDYAGSTITQKLEVLMAGGYIIQRIDENLTYDYLHSSEDNLWSMLYLTGYLTKLRENDYEGELLEGTMALIIPNAEIKEIFETTVIKWFDDSAKIWDRKHLFDAVWEGDSGEITLEMSKLLRKTISYHDYREDFYHAFLAGIFAGAGYMVESNKEHGEGRSDVVVYDSMNARVAIFEAKYSKSREEMERDCDRAIEQINKKMYASEYEDDYDEILCYGISFFKKRCFVKKK